MRPGIADYLRDHAVPAADIITPNRYEVERLLGTKLNTVADAKAAIAALQAKGPRTVLITSLRTEATPAGAMDMMVGEGGQYWLLRTPLEDVQVNGAGDAISALFLFHRLATGSAAAALSNPRPAAAHGGGEVARDPDRGGAGGVREPDHALHRHAGLIPFPAPGSAPRAGSAAAAAFSPHRGTILGA